MRQYILLFLLPLLALSQVMFAQGTEPQGYTVGGIHIEGIEHGDQTAYIAYTGLRVGDKITIPGPETADAIKKLWKQQLFSDISIEIERIQDEKVFLVIKVKERPRMSGFTFRGITNSSAKDLKEKLNFYRGTIWTAEKENRAIRIAKNFFIEKGYLNTKVNIFIEPEAYLKDMVKIKIAVDKGPRVKINRIRMEGNQDFADARLKGKMKEFKERKWWRFWSRSKYIPAELAGAKKAIVEYYNEQGYRDAEVLFDSVSVYDDNSVDLELRLHEGDQYYFRNITWSGNIKYSSDTLTHLLAIRKGEVYNQKHLEQKLMLDQLGRDISTLYLDDGYLFFNVEPVEILVEEDSLDIEIRISEGPQATIRKIIVEGNTKTSDYVILRELRTLPGQKFSRSDLMRSQREVLNLGFFNQETMQVVPIPDPVTGQVDIKYVVEEKPSDQLQVQGGWGGRLRDPVTGDVIAGGFVGTVNLAFNNFSTKRFFKKGSWSPIPSGDGQKLSLGVQMNGTGWQNYFISFLEPWLGGKKPNSLGANFSYSLNRVVRTGFKMKTISTGLDYGKRMKFPDDFFRSFTTLQYKFYDLENASSFFGTIDFDEGKINIITLRQTFSRSSIDAPLFPRSGSEITLSVEGTPPYSLFQPGKDYSEISDKEKFRFLEYHKWKFNSSWYFPIAKNFVIRPRLQFGYLGTYDPNYGISPFERFNMGGSGFGQFSFFGQEFISLRGYPDNSIGPRAIEGDPLSPTVGGNIFTKISLELRVPLTLNQAAPIWMVGFLEGGNVWLGLRNYNPFELKRTAGVGIRVVVPMIGLLGVDWGYGFDPVTSGGLISGSRFNFVIGQEF